MTIFQGEIICEKMFHGNVMRSSVTQIFFWKYEMMSDKCTLYKLLRHFIYRFLEVRETEYVKNVVQNCLHLGSTM